MRSGASQLKGTSAAAIFVKGHYAYLLDAYVTDPGGTNSWLHILDIEDDGDIEECARLGIRQGRGVFVAGDSMYVITDGGLVKYDVTDPCDPDSLYFDQYRCFIGTDMYLTDDYAYVSIDPNSVEVWDISEGIDRQDPWSPPAGSPQGIHVRGPYAYIACESLNIWIRNIGTSTDYEVEAVGTSYDVYNVGLEDTNRAITYEAASSFIRAWDTTDPEDVSSLGQYNSSGPVCQSVHATGDWVYRLGDSYKVEVFPVEYDTPSRHTSYTAPGQLLDFHVVHEHYTRGLIDPVWGSAHVFGIYRDSDTVALWIYNPTGREQRVDGFEYGDVNKDGNINISDVLLLGYYVFQGYNGSVKDLDAADVNCDGEINSYDCDYLAEYLWSSGPAPGLDCDFYDDW
jgi:hypothetical protein